MNNFATIADCNQTFPVCCGTPELSRILQPRCKRDAVIMQAHKGMGGSRASPCKWSHAELLVHTRAFVNLRRFAEPNFSGFDLNQNQTNIEKLGSKICKTRFCPSFCETQVSRSWSRRERGPGRRYRPLVIAFSHRFLRVRRRVAKMPTFF
jgi:hypothetical protein